MSQTLHFPELPFYLTVRLIANADRDDVSIEVQSTVHVNRIVKLPHSYSTEYVEAYPQHVRSDVLRWIVERYGLTLEDVRYS